MSKSIKKNLRKNTNRGFTLIETLVYLALFSIIMGGVVVCAYQIFESSGRTQTHSMVQEEGDYLIAKFKWVLSGTQGVIAPAAPPTGTPCLTSDTLSVNKWDATIGTLLVSLLGHDLTISRNGNPAKLLNNSNIEISNLQFSHCYTGGMNPESVSASFRVTALTPNGMPISQDFFTSDYTHR